MATHHHEITEHKIGTMDITEQKKTFAGFIKFATWTAILSILVLIFMPSFFDHPLLTGLVDVALMAAYLALLWVAARADDAEG